MAWPNFQVRMRRRRVFGTAGSLSATMAASSVTCWFVAEVRVIVAVARTGRIDSGRRASVAAAACSPSQRYFGTGDAHALSSTAAIMATSSPDLIAPPPARGAGFFPWGGGAGFRGTRRPALTAPLPARGGGFCRGGGGGGFDKPQTQGVF